MARGRGSQTTDKEMRVIRRRPGVSDPLQRAAERLDRAGAVRALNRAFNPDKKSWVEQEQQFIRSAAKSLHESIKEYAGSEPSWRAFLRLYAGAAQYSISNTLWAQTQLLRKGVDTQGLLLSESGWKALGRKIKPGYYPSKEGWDDRYAAEMFAAVFAKKKKGDEDEDEKSPLPSRPVGFRAFRVFHEEATCAPDGGEPTPLPRVNWIGASGSEQDVAHLKADMELICKREGIEIVTSASGAPALGARYDRDTKRIIVDSTLPPAEQAVATLAAVCEHYGPAAKAADDDELKRRMAAIESTKFAVASLYGLATDSQSFPFLSEIAKDDKQLSALNRDISSRAKKIMEEIDPRLRIKARALAEGKSEPKAKTDGRRVVRRRAAKRS